MREFWHKILVFGQHIALFGECVWQPFQILKPVGNDIMVPAYDSGAVLESYRFEVIVLDPI